MKKVIVILILVFAGAISASAQWYAGGAIAGTYEKSNGTEAWGVNLSPEVGYFLTDDMIVGGRITYGRSNTAIVGPGVNFSSATTNALTINPFAIWRLTNFGPILFGVETGLQFIPEQKSVDSTTFAAYAVPVMGYPLTDRFLLRSSLDFAGVMLIADCDGYYGIGAGAHTNRVLSLGNLSFGFVYRF